VIERFQNPFRIDVANRRQIACQTYNIVQRVYFIFVEKFKLF
jgi:hypothetical protein